MSKKNNRATRARQHEFDRKREKEQLEKKAAKGKPRADKMKVDSGKIKKKQLKVGKKRKFQLKKTAQVKAKASQAMEIDS